MFPWCRSWILWLCTPCGHLIFGGENSNTTACCVGWPQELVCSCRDVPNWLGVERLLTASDPVPSECSHAPAGSGPLALHCSWGVGMVGRPGRLCGLTALAAQVATGSHFSSQVLLTRSFPGWLALWLWEAWMPSLWLWGEWG